MKEVQVVEPIRNKEDINKILGWFHDNYPKYEVIFSLGIYSGLRVSDILKLKIEDVTDTDFVRIREQKTNKYKMFPLSPMIKKLLSRYCTGRSLAEPLFLGNKGQKLDRSQVYRMINRACCELGIKGNFGTHTMRKTFGYHHYKKFRDVAILQAIFNHSSPEVTKRYIGITQDEINNSYLSINYDEEDEGTQLLNKYNFYDVAFEKSNIKQNIYSADTAEKIVKYLRNYIEMGSGRHRDFAIDLLDVACK